MSPPDLTRADPSFDRYARLTRRILGTPVAMVSLIDDDRQRMPGGAGLPEPVDSTRELPLSHSICRHVVADEAPLVVADTRLDERLADNGGVVDHGVVAYAGWPLTDRAGHVVGSLCAIDTEVRDWTEEQLAALEDLAEACSAELTARELSRSARAEVSQVVHQVEVGQVLLALSEGLAGTTTLSDIVAAVERVGVDQLDCRGAGLWLDGQALGSGDGTVLTHVPNEKLVWGPAALITEMSVDLANPLGNAYLNRRPLFLADRAAQDLQFPAMPGTKDAGEARAVLPLQMGGQSIGSLVLTWSERRAFTSELQTTIGALTAYTSQAVQRALLLAERVNASMVLQDSMLSSELPQPDDLELSARYRPAGQRDQVGGDWYDAVLLPSGCTAVIIGDVVGHDLRAAAGMGQIRNVLRALAWAEDELPSHVVASLDRALPDLSVDAMATLVLGRIEQTEQEHAEGVRTFRWTNAGHPPPLLIDPERGCSWLTGRAGGPMIGVAPDQPRDDEQVRLDPGSTLLLYTDGLIERRGEDLELGFERLVTSAIRHGDADVEGLLDGLLDDLLVDDLEDDVAVLAVRMHEQ